MAVDLLKRNRSIQEAVSSLVTSSQISPRQAYRYIHRAQQAKHPLPLPENKVVFTVKLPESLIGRVRTRAHRQGQSISDWVGEALKASLARSRRYG